MEKIEAISVAVERGGQPDTAGADASLCSTPTGNLLPLLHEIRHALAAWLERGEPHIIDLRTIPMSPGEEERLLELIGGGEVQARLQALGGSEVTETAFAGVWLVTHYSEDGVQIGRFIEVCRIPEILKSQTADADMALQRLDDLLSHPEATV